MNGDGADACLVYPCPTCKAGPGQPCKKSGGRPVYAHMARPHPETVERRNNQQARFDAMLDPAVKAWLEKQCVEASEGSTFAAAFRAGWRAAVEAALKVLSEDSAK